MQITFGDGYLDPYETGLNSKYYGYDYEIYEDPPTAQLSLSHSEFYARAKHLFDEFRTEMLEEKVDESERMDYPELYQYEQVGHPTLDFLFIDHPRLFADLCHYIDFDLLQALLHPEPLKVNPTIWILGIIDIETSPSGIVIRLAMHNANFRPEDLN